MSFTESALFNSLTDEEKNKLFQTKLAGEIQDAPPDLLANTINGMAESQNPAVDLGRISVVGKLQGAINGMPGQTIESPQSIQQPTNRLAQNIGSGLGKFVSSVGLGATQTPIDMTNRGWESNLGGTIGATIGNEVLNQLFYGKSANKVTTPELYNTKPESAKQEKLIEASKIRYEIQHSPEEAQAIGEAIINGTQAPDLKGMYWAQKDVRVYLAKKGFNLFKAQKDWLATQNAIKSLTSTQQVRLEQVLSSVENQIPMLQKLSNDFDRTGWRPVNKIELMAAVNGIDKEKATVAVKYLGQINTMRDELAQAFSGGYSPTDSAFKLADAVLDPLYNAKQMDASLEQLQFNLNTRRNAISQSGQESLKAASSLYNQQEQPQSIVTPDLGNQIDEILKKRGGK